MLTVTRAHLTEIIHAEVGLSRNECADLLESVLSRVSTTLEDGESVKISGFGTFSVRQKGRRVGRNPKTGEEVPILPRRVLVFRPSHVLKTRINGGTASDADDDG
jgi:integration host factor subunit alpha